MNSPAWPVLSRSLYCTLGPTFLRSLLFTPLAAEPECSDRVLANSCSKDWPLATARASLPLLVFSTLKALKPDHSTAYWSLPFLSAVELPTSPAIGNALSLAPVIGQPVSLSLLPPSSKLDW